MPLMNSFSQGEGTGPAGFGGTTGFAAATVAAGFGGTAALGFVSVAAWGGLGEETFCSAAGFAGGCDVSGDIPSTLLSSGISVPVLTQNSFRDYSLYSP